MRHANLIGTVLALSLVFVASSAADVITVCTDGGDHATIQGALDVASAGDEIVVCCGTYFENIVMTNGVHLRSETGDPGCVTINGLQQGSVVTCDDLDETTIIAGFTITGGVGNDGGGMVVTDSSPTVVNCIFVGNTASDGGGMEVASSGESVSAPRIVNCLFQNNHANVGVNPDGGAVRIVDSEAHFANCTFYGNTAILHGGGIACIRSVSEFVNCVFWGNSDGGGTGESAQLYSDDSSSVTVTHSCIQGLDTFAGDGNIGDDPVLVDPDGPDDDPATWEDNDLRLCFLSPCIDAGDSTSVPDGVLVDLDGCGRIVDAPMVPDTGIPAGIVPVVADMGAYELPHFRLGDCNRDGDVNAYDIDGFILLVGGGC
ncbi:MAG: hypothetical protein ABIG44_15450 [Planctomycetota bacterium]